MLIYFYWFCMKVVVAWIVLNGRKGCGDDHLVMFTDTPAEKSWQNLPIIKNRARCSSEVAESLLKQDFTSQGLVLYHVLSCAQHRIGGWDVST